MTGEITKRNPTGTVGTVGFRLTLERIPGYRAQTGIIDVNGPEFVAMAKRSRIDDAVEWLACELARHLGVMRSDVDINEETGRGVSGGRRFRLIAHYQGKPKESTDGCAAFTHWKNSASNTPKQIPSYIDI